MGLGDFLLDLGGLRFGWFLVVSFDFVNCTHSYVYAVLK